MVGFRKIVRRVSSFYVGGTQGHGVLNHVFFKIISQKIEQYPQAPSSETKELSGRR